MIRSMASLCRGTSATKETDSLDILDYELKNKRIDD